MAKETKVEEPVQGTETAQTENTAVVIFDKAAENIVNALPDIPKEMNIGGVDYSVEKIKEAVQLVKSIKVELPEEGESHEQFLAKQKVYEEMKENKKKLQKTRTQAEAFRKKISTPFNNWVKALKQVTDGFGEAAKEGEDYATEQIQKWEDYEEAKRQEEENRLRKQVEERTFQLQQLGGILDPTVNYWRFNHSIESEIDNTKLIDMDDSEWNGYIQKVEQAYNIAKAKEEAEKAELIALREKAYTARVQMLQLMQYEPSGESFIKNGYTITPEDIKSLTDDVWMSTLMSHNTPKPEPVNPFSKVTTEATTQSFPTQEAPAANDPFARPATQTFNQIVNKDEPQNVGDAFATVIPELPNPYFNEEGKYVTQELGKTTIVIFDEKYRGNVFSELNVVDVKFQGTWPTGLSFIIYKH